MTAIRRCDTPLGPCLLAGDEAALTGLWFVGAKHFARTLPEDAREYRLSVLDDAEAWLRAYFAGERPDPKAIPLRLKGTAFELAVWTLLREIPYGQTTTYGALAQALMQGSGKRACAQAVGGAVGRNPVSILIPCHRVLGRDVGLTGYAGGVEKKAALLRLEEIGDFSPKNESKREAKRGV